MFLVSGSVSWLEVLRRDRQCTVSRLKSAFNTSHAALTPAFLARRSHWPSRRAASTLIGRCGRGVREWDRNEEIGAEGCLEGIVSQLISPLRWWIYWKLGARRPWSVYDTGGRYRYVTLKQTSRVIYRLFTPQVKVAKHLKI